MTICEVVGRELGAELAQRPAAAKTSVLAAVSGGADSTALLHCLSSLCRTSGITLIACHFVHGLRSEQSHSEDLLAVRKACAGLGVPLVTGAPPEGAIRRTAESSGSGIEAAARSWRYEFFRKSAVATGCTIVCTAHTEDDQVETVLMSMERGVDPIGLAGIPRRRVLDDGVVLLRPMLSVSRADVEGHLIDCGTGWRDDPSNNDLRYTRNRLRHVVLPALERDDPGLRAGILSLADDARRRRADAEREASQLVWTHDGAASTTPAGPFFSASRAARLVSLFAQARVRGMIRPSSRLSVRFFAPLLGDQVGDGILVSARGCRIERSGGLLRWGPAVVRRAEYGYLRRVTLGVAVDLPAGRRLTVYSGKKEITDNHPSVIELNQVHLPLVVRSRRIGDVLQRVGGRKPVSTVLSEQGIPPGERDIVPVLCDRTGILAVLAGFSAAGHDVVAQRPGGGGRNCILVMTTASVRRDNPDV